MQAEQDEVPVFTLVGWDKLAVKTARFWLAEAIAADVNMDKIMKVIAHIRALEDYADAHPDRMKLPD